jgi:hypothetical protein
MSPIEETAKYLQQLAKLPRGEHPDLRELRRQVEEGWLDDEILDYWRKRRPRMPLRDERHVLMVHVRRLREGQGEPVVRGLTRRQVENAYRAVAVDPKRRGRRPSREAVAKALDTSEATLVRACKEGLECHPWPGSLEIDDLTPS